jgi:arsenate reductase-like glutaredoxin family protein
MESRPRKKRFSKYILSNIVFYLPLRPSLHLRLVSRTFDDAVFIGLNCSFDELTLQADRFQYLLDTDFDEKTKREHGELSKKELIINKNLRFFLSQAKLADNLFKNHLEIAKLLRPNHLIEKPVIATLILLKRCPPMKAAVDFLNKSDIDEVWIKCRKELKSKEFIKLLEKFDIRRVTQNEVALIRSLFANDPWMAAGLIARESNFAT